MTTRLSLLNYLVTKPRGLMPRYSGKFHSSAGLITHSCTTPINVILKTLWYKVRKKHYLLTFLCLWVSYKSHCKHRLFPKAALTS